MTDRAGGRREARRESRRTGRPIGGQPETITRVQVDVFRAMLEYPGRSWTIKELEAEAKITRRTAYGVMAGLAKRGMVVGTRSEVRAQGGLRAWHYRLADASAEDLARRIVDDHRELFQRDTSAAYDPAP